MSSRRVSLPPFYCRMSLTHEALRLYPPVPVNSRTALRTTVLPMGGGPDRKSPVLIPKGAAVAYSVYTMHRRPDLYGMDAEIFRPERWDEDMPMSQDNTNAQWGYLPFNGGPRICLGSKCFLPLESMRRPDIINYSSYSGFRPYRSLIYGCTNYSEISDNQVAGR